MSPLIAILIVVATTGLVAWLATRRSGPRVTTIETRREEEDGR